MEQQDQQVILASLVLLAPRVGLVQPEPRARLDRGARLGPLVFQVHEEALGPSEHLDQVAQLGCLVFLESTEPVVLTERRDYLEDLDQMASLEPLVEVAHLVTREIVVHQDQEEIQEALVQWDRWVEQDLLVHWERLVRLGLLVLVVEEDSRGRSAQLVPQEFQAVLVCLGPQEPLDQQDQGEHKALPARLGPQEPVEVRDLVVAQGRSVQLVRRVLSVPLDLPEQLEQEVLPGQLEALEQQVLLGLLGPQVPQD